MADFENADLEPTDEGLGEGLGETPTNPTETPTTPTPDARRTAETKKPVSWKDDPDYRKYQAERDKHTEQQRRLEALERDREQERQRLAWYEQQLEALQTQHLDEPQKLAYENQKLKRMMAAIQQEKQIQEDKAKIFQRITARFGPVGVPYETYANAQDADEAWDLAADYALKNLPQRAAQQQQAAAVKKEANQVYLGGGTTGAVDDAWEAEAKRLLAKKDSIGYARHLLKRKYE